MQHSLNGSDWQILGLIPTEWVWRRIGDAATDLDNLRPTAPPWYPATVPGDVQSDLIDAGVLPDPWYEENSRACEWTSQRDWVYRLDFTPKPDWAGRHVRLRFDGVDPSGHIFLNGHHLGDHSGMYVPFEFDVSGLLRYGELNHLIVVVDHAPSEPDIQGQIGWTSQIRLWKARFAYDWDWCTRLVPIGIWDDVSLIINDQTWIGDVWVRPVLNEALDAATVHITTLLGCISSMPVHLEVQILRDGNRVAVSSASGTTDNDSKLSTVIALRNPALWYPNGYGPQNLYEAKVVLKDDGGEILDERSVGFGIRRIKPVANDNAPADSLPYVFEVNGLKTFIKGWNWAPVNQLYGRPHREQYERNLKLAAAAHCNLLRVWGGGLLERESFYSLCDELGIMVWQEFIQSSSGVDNEPGTDEKYLSYCRKTAEAMIPRRRNHPSLVIWCGGNELTRASDGVPLDKTHPNIKTLAEAVERLDPDRVFLPTSPSGPVFGANPDHLGRMHDVHGNWNYLGDPEHYHFFNQIDPLFHSEFGVEGAANRDTIDRAIRPEYQWPPDFSNPHWCFHANWWVDRQSVEKLFGPLSNMEDYVKASQWVQAEGLRYAIEASRRRKWRTSGTIPWQFNEPWPNVVGTYCVDYYGKPKPAYYAVQSAYAPLLISAQYEKLVWNPAEVWRAGVWLNNSLNQAREVRYQCSLVQLVDGKELAAAHGEVVAQPASAIQLTEMQYEIPSDYNGILALRLTAEDQKGMVVENSYIYSVKPLGSTQSPFRGLLEVDQTDIRVERSDQSLIAVQNVGSAPALYVILHPEDDYSALIFSDGYFCLAKGETRQLRYAGTGRFKTRSWNGRNDPSNEGAHRIG